MKVVINVLTLPFCSETKPPLDEDEDLTVLPKQVFASASKVKNLQLKINK